MATSQDSSQGKRAAHFSSSNAASDTSARRRRAATPRGSAHAAQTGRRSASSSSGQQGAVAGASSASGNQGMSERTARATQRAAAAHKRRAQNEKPAKKSGVPVVAILALVLVFTMVGVGFLVVPRLFQSHKVETTEQYPAGEEVVVTIPDGAGGTQIAQLLKESHVISDESTFYQEVQKQNADASMKSGSYQFLTGANVSEVVRQLVAGPNATQFQLTIPEGKTLTQTAELVQNQLGISAEDFMEQAKASNYVDDYPFLESAANNGYDSLEGYLFPKKYDLGGSDMTADAVIRAMLNQYQTETQSLDFDAARTTIRERYTGTLSDGSSSSLELSDYAFIKLASVIEKEAVTDEDRPLISSVFYNRMGRNFPGLGYVRPYLESDATMMYVTGGEVTASDLQTDSPYNSYLNQYLPPTPICSPSIESIKAALDPSDTDYFYFFINDVVHQFSETYNEHQQAINESLNS